MVKLEPKYLLNIRVENMPRKGIARNILSIGRVAVSVVQRRTRSKQLLQNSFGAEFDQAI